MDVKILKEIGLTDGEIRVYKALINLGKASSGPIMKKSGISSSKIYLILEKLINKGIVSFVIENNVKKFQVTNPKNLVEYVNKKQKELEKVRGQTENFALQLTKTLGNYEEESAQIYKGFAGLRVAFQNIIDELEKGDDYLAFSFSKEEYSKKVMIFFDNLHPQRIEKGINTKIIVDTKIKNTFLKYFKKKKNFDFKFIELALPSALTIGKNRIILTLWGENPMAFEIISKRMAEKYKEFFYEMWK